MKLLSISTLASVLLISAFSAQAQSAAPVAPAAPPVAAPAAPAAPAARHARKGKIDLNTASLDDLKSLPEIGDVDAQKIVDGRPYERKDQLVSKNILPEAAYKKIKKHLVARQPKGARKSSAH